MDERVETPEGFRPYSLDGDTILGCLTGRLDVESVPAYPVHRGQRTGVPAMKHRSAIRRGFRAAL